MDAHVRRKTTTSLAILTVIGYSLPTQASIIYNTHGLYTIQTQTIDNVLIDHAAAEVTIDTGGIVRGVAGMEPSRRAAVYVRAGDFNLTGNARIIADAGQNAVDITSSRATVRIGGHSSIAGNVFANGATSGWSREETASQRLYIQDSALLVGDINYSGHLRIQDQALVVGSIQGSASMSMNMTGGVVTGSVGVGGLNDYVVQMSGGSILGSLGGSAAYIDLTMSGGYIGQGLHSQAIIDGEIKGGEIDGGIWINEFTSGSTQLSISGGRFDATSDNWLFSFSEEPQVTSLGTRSLLDLWGGEFGYDEEGLGFFLDDGINFSVHGRDLVYSDGWLSGYLMDGSWFSNALTFGSNWQGNFTIHNVPEPESIGLFLIGLVGMTLARRRSIEHRA